MVYVMACCFIAEIYLKRQTLWKGLCFRLKGIVISFSHLNNLISCLNSFLENYSLIVSVSVLHFKWSDAYQYAYILWLVEREELHFRTDWYPTKTWNISHAQFALLFNYHSWWSRMGESSFNVYYILCDVPLYLAGLPTCKIMYHRHNSCQLLAVSNVLVRTQDLSGITRRLQSDLPLSFSSELFLDF